MRTLISRYTGTLQNAGQLGAAALLIVCGGAVAMIVVMHLVDPVHFGLWWGPHAFFFGSATAADHFHQADGSTLYRLALIIVPLCVLVSNELFGFVRARSRSPT